MTDYINAVRRALRDQHGFKPSGGTPEEPIFKTIPDGTYPCRIKGKLKRVKIKNNAIFIPSQHLEMVKAKARKTRRTVKET